ncbi:transposase [Streptomyces sp. LP05-1]|uniref:Transposase n=1 Tax=Streptomyces pyxinae TaxID=2970734 RepID=A0ABT2CF13_9ACTN|nr:transposase [Streptomyces sp. LP05-1]MCS0635978.1 transposase [Streptomyces sp. LP05-1]
MSDGFRPTTGEENRDETGFVDLPAQYGSVPRAPRQPPLMGCRRCGSPVEGLPEGRLVRWHCGHCGYVIHS